MKKSKCTLCGASCPKPDSYKVEPLCDRCEERLQYEMDRDYSELLLAEQWREEG